MRKWFCRSRPFCKAIKKEGKDFQVQAGKAWTFPAIKLGRKAFCIVKVRNTGRITTTCFLNPAKLKTKKKAHQKPTQKKQSLTKVCLLWIKAYEHDTKIIVFWIGAMSVTSMLSGLFLGQCLFLRRLLMAFDNCLAFQ